MNPRPLFRWLNVITLACMLLLNITGTTVQAAGLAEPTPVLITDSADYAPNTLVTVTGYGFEPNTEYALPVTRPNGSIVYGDGSFLPGYDTVYSNIRGELQYIYQLNGVLGVYEVRAYRVDSWTGGDYSAQPVTSITFTDGPGPSANLDQCANGSVTNPTTTCEWVNGNLGASKAHYVEGDSVAYRMRLDNLSTGGAGHTLTIGWDTTKSGTHAEDFLTNYNRTVVDADPCLGVTGCGLPTTYPIPSDPSVSAAGVAQILGDFTLFGGTITGLSSYTTVAEETTITISFTADIPNPVLAWGGHIATRADWGNGNAAVNIPGSPYHMRLKGLNGGGGSQDRSLSADAVIYPGRITITKQASPEGPTAFDFSAGPAPLSPFTLVDDGSSTDTIVFDLITTFTTYTVTENLPPGWTLDGITCQDPTGATTVNLPAHSASIGLVEGDYVACTFNDSQQTGTLTVVKTVNNRFGGSLQVSDFPLAVNGSPVTSGQAVTLPVGSYTVSETQQPGYTASAWGGDCAPDGTVSLLVNENKTCTITNSDVQPLLTVTKVVDNTGGGTWQANDFPLFVDGAQVASGAQNGYNAGAHTVSETGNSDYTATFSGDCAADGTVVLAVGDVKTCTITNTFTARPGIQVVKSYTGGPFALGSTIPYSYVITNTGNVALSDVSLVDDILGPVTLNQTVLQPGEQATGTASHLVSQANIDAGTLTNIATASGTTPGGSTLTATDTETVTFAQNAAITLEKTATETGFGAVGAILHYTLVATNTGSVTLSNVTISDPRLGTLACTPDQPATLAPKATLTCTGSYTATQADLDAGKVDNTATASGDFGGDSYTASDSASVPAEQRPALSIDKTAAPDKYDQVGDVIAYSYLVTNTGNITLYGIRVVDNRVTVACPDTTAGLPPAGTLTCTASYTITQADLDHGSVYNSAYATDGATQSPPDEVTVNGVQSPAIRISKSPDVQQVAQGGTATFDITVENTGNVILTGVTVSDPLAPDCDRAIGELAPGASSSYTCTAVVSADLTNLATVTATPPAGENLTASDTAVVDVLPLIALTKTASPTSVAEPGGTVTFTVRVDNPSAEAVTLTSLVDDVYGDLNGQGACALPQTIAAGGAYSCEFSRQVTGEPGSRHVDVVTGTAADNEGNPASDTGTATVTISDVLPTVSLTKTADPASLPEPGGVFTFTLAITNTSVEPVAITALSDTHGLSDECMGLLGTVLAAGASVSCSNPVTHTEPGSYPNTASVTVTDNEQNTASASDTETVTVTDVRPAVTLEKSVLTAELPEPGGDFTFTLTITNTSVEPVTISALTDDNALSPECNALVKTTLAAGASASCDYVVSHTAVGSYPNTANVTVMDNDGNAASASDSQTVRVTDLLPTVTLDKTVTPGTRPEPGGYFNYALTITNTSAEPVTITALGDDYPLTAACTDLIGDTLPAGASISCYYELRHTEAGTYPNTATVTVADNENNLAGASDSATVTITDVLPTVTLDKQVTPATLPEPGGEFSFSLVITNTSIEPVTITALSDTHPLPEGCTRMVGFSLDPGVSAICYYTVSHGEAGSYDNTASVTVEDNEHNPASASDTETVTVSDAAPTVTLDKSVTPASLPEPGGNFAYTLTITNTSSEPVTLTALTDSVADDACPDLIGANLPAGASLTCTYTIPYVAPGVYPNTATVEVADNEGSPASASDSASAEVTNLPPSIRVEKVADPESLPEPGGPVTFTVSVRNNSAFEPVYLTAIGDDIYGDLTNSANPLLQSTTCALVEIAPEAWYTCNFVANVTGEPGTYTDVVTVTAQDNEHTTDTASDSATVTLTDRLPTVSLDKTADPLTRPEPGGTFTFTLAITNTSLEPVTITALTDTNTLAPECAALVGTTLASYARATCSYTVSHEEAGSYDNTATVTVQDNEHNPAGARATATVTVTDVAPAVDLTKTVEPATLPEPGGLFTYTLTIANTSLEPVIITALTDTHALSAECLALVSTSIPVGETVSCAYTATFTNAGTYPNTATVTVEDNEGDPAGDSASASVTVTDTLPVVTLVKTADRTSLPEPGGVFTYTLTITNPSIEPVVITALTDDNILSPECTALVGTPLAAGASATCQYSVTHTDAGVYPNAASVTVADDEGNTAGASDDETVTVTDQTPLVDLVKSVDSNATFNVGDTATYTLTLTNTSAEPVTITTLTDTNPLSSACLALVGTTLAGGASTHCTYTVTRTTAGTYPNTASVSVADNEGNPAGDTAELAVTVYAPVVSKTALGSFSEQHDWDVFKTVNTVAQRVSAGKKADFVWSVRVDETVHGEDYLVVGEITVVNPNPDDPMTLTLADVLDDGSVASITSCSGGTWASPNLTVPGGSTAVCSYTVVPTGDLADFNAALPDQVNLSIRYGAAGDPAYFPVVAISNGGALDGFYQGWCADIDASIYPVTTYQANVYSSYESIPAGLIEHPENLDLVNWIINQDFVGKPAGGTLGTYTFGDVQRVIWELLEDDGTTNTNGLYEWSQARVDQIKAAALANGEGFIPTCSDYIAVILQPVDGQQLVTIAQVTFASLGLDCASSNAVTAVLNNVEIPASADILWSADVVNPTATVDDDQAPAGPTTVDHDVLITYTDPQGYTCSSDPAAYTNGFYAYQESNTAVLTYATGSDSATASTVVKCYRPVVEVLKTAKTVSVPETGGNATYTYLVKNGGSLSVAIATLTDDRFGSLTGDEDCQVGTVLAPAASCTFEATFALPASDFPAAHVNTFTATVVDDNGNPASDSDDASVAYTDVKPAITVSKTAENAPATVPETGGSVKYTFTVTNTGLEAVGITQLSDNRFGTLAGDEDCRVGAVLAGSGGTCSFEATFRIPVGDFPGAHTNTFTAKVTDGDGNYAVASDSETITYSDVLPDISVTKTASPTRVPEPGANVVFTFIVTNNGPEAATLKALSDSRFGALTGDTDCYVGKTLASGASCAFTLTRKVSGNAGLVHENTFTARAADNDGNSDTASAAATVTVTDVLPTIQVDKTPNKTSVIFTGGYVTFTVKVKNTSVEPVRLTALADDMFGDLNGQGTCSVPRTLAVGAIYSCYFTRWIASPVTVYETTYHVDTVTGTAIDDENNAATDTGTAKVKFYWRGRTPGYWKTYLTLWPKWSLVNYAGKTVSITTTTPVRSVFNVPQELLKCSSTTCILDLNADGKNDTLLQAMNYKGGTNLAGKAQVLLRAAVAGLLNERYFGVRYPAYDSVADLINGVNATLALKDIDAYTQLAAALDWWNNGVQ